MKAILGTPTRRLFLMAWIGSLVLLGGVWRQWGDWPALQRDQAALFVLGSVMLLAPWLAGPGLLSVLRRRASGGINLPHAEYWFSGERRAASLDRLCPYLEIFGAILSVFLSAVLLIFLGERVDSAVATVSALMFVTAMVLFLGATVIWVRSLLRAFPEPEPATRGVSTSRLPRRPAPHGQAHRPRR